MFLESQLRLQTTLMDSTDNLISMASLMVKLKQLFQDYYSHDFIQQQSSINHREKLRSGIESLYQVTQSSPKDDKSGNDGKSGLVALHEFCTAATKWIGEVRLARQPNDAKPADCKRRVLKPCAHGKLFCEQQRLLCLWEKFEGNQRWNQRLDEQLWNAIDNACRDSDELVTSLLHVFCSVASSASNASNASSAATEPTLDEVKVHPLLGDAQVGPKHQSHFFMSRDVKAAHANKAKQTCAYASFSDSETPLHDPVMNGHLLERTVEVALGELRDLSYVGEKELQRQFGRQRVSVDHLITTPCATFLVQYKWRTHVPIKDIRAICDDMSFIESHFEPGQRVIKVLVLRCSISKPAQDLLLQHNIFTIETNDMLLAVQRVVSLVATDSAAETERALKAAQHFVQANSSGQA